jgi:tetratricopeptide (TPR) repeat protein
VHITVICPGCHNRYQVDASLQHKAIRCPNSACRKIIEVDKCMDAPPAAAASSAPQRPAAPAPDRPSGRSTGTNQSSGSVGEVVPLLSAEQAGRSTVPQAAPAGAPLSYHQAPPVRKPPGETIPAQAPPREPADWRSAPPPAKRSAEPAPAPRTERRVAAPAPQAEPAQPQRADWHEAPPPTPDKSKDTARLDRAALTQRMQVRTEGANDTMVPPVRRPPSEPVTTSVSEQFSAARKRRHARLMIGSVVGIVSLVILLAGLGVWNFFRETEQKDRRQAETAYREQRYTEASVAYRKLWTQFPESADANEYHFLERLSDVMAQLRSATSAPDTTLNLVAEFVKDYETSPFLKKHGRELGSALVQWVRGKADAVAQKQGTLPEGFLERGRKFVEEMLSLAPESVKAEELAQLDKSIKAAQEVLVLSLKHDHALQALEKLISLPPADGLREARRIIEQQKRDEPNFDQDGKITEVLGKLYNSHFESVTYTPSDIPPEPTRHVEDRAPGILVEQLVQGQPPLRPANDPVVLALVRGVLYALAESNGEIVWAMRVGIDTSSLPLRLPAVGSRPELVLVLSSDTLTLTALNVATGDPLWKYHLSAPCLGQPVVVDLRAFIPTYDGKVHEIELAGGKLLGTYDLKQHLTVGGTRQPGTKLVYFPAEDSCVYVLDVALKKCQAILYSEHPSGSLRSEPVLVGEADPNGTQGYLILSQANGLEGSRLRAFTLPIQAGQTAAVPPELTTPGWPWFQPYHDTEKLVLATDAGAIGLFGIKQLGSSDSPLWPMLRDGLRVAAPPTFAAGTSAGRSQVVSCQGDDLWVLIQGALQKFTMTLSSSAGPRLTVDPLWQRPLLLGSPLHRSQVDATGTKLFLVTQSPNRQGCLATAVDADSKQVLWQRQLGLVTQGEPLLLGSNSGSQGVVTLDQSGGVFAFHPSNHASMAESQWQLGGVSLGGPLDDTAGPAPALYRGSDGLSAYEVAFPAKGTKLLLRRFVLDKEGKPLPPQANDEKVVELPSPAAGNPAINSHSLLLPLQDGSLMRVRLPPDTSQQQVGPDWRAGRGNPDIRCHVVWLNDDEFLTTDGARGLNYWSWPLGKGYVALPKGKDPKDPTAEVRARIVSAPLVVPSAPAAAGARPEAQVCVPDAEGTLTLLHGVQLEETRHWDLGGKITSGPFLRGSKIGCIVDRRRLIWLDPTQAAPLWEYRSPGEEIVGQPQLVEDLLVVADQSGRFVGVDPSTGRTVGQGYTLKASVAPAATPVAFGPQRVFAPLTDGTVMLLSLNFLREPRKGFPLVR